MAYFIKNDHTYDDTIKGIEVSIKSSDHGPFDTVEEAVDYWINYNGGSVGLYHSSINVYEVD